MNLNEIREQIISLFPDPEFVSGELLARLVLLVAQAQENGYNRGRTDPDRDMIFYETANQASAEVLALYDKKSS